MVTPDLMQAAEWATAGLALAGLGQCAGGLLAWRRFRAAAARIPRDLPGVTILKPLHGDEPLLEDALATICRQDYPVFQVVFGLQDPDDPALAVLHRLRDRFPTVDMAVVVERTQHGANRKIGNLINAFAEARHDVVVIADSDMHVAPDYLRRLVAALEQPGVGLVTSIYAGLPASGSIAARLGAAYINHAFMPGALMARALGRRDCLGATMALTRATLERVGGLRALVDHLADDAVLGHRVLALGQAIALADTVPRTTVPEVSVSALMKHEVRWARTIRSLAPAGFVSMALQFPLFWAVLTLLLATGAGWAWGLLAVTWGVRAAVAGMLDRDLQAGTRLGAWLLPLRDVLSIGVMLASYRSRRVAWRGQMMIAARPPLARREGFAKP